MHVALSFSFSDNGIEWYTHLILLSKSASYMYMIPSLCFWGKNIKQHWHLIMSLLVSDSYMSMILSILFYNNNIEQYRHHILHMCVKDLLNGDSLQENIRQQVSDAIRFSWENADFSVTHAAICVCVNTLRPIQNEMDAISQTTCSSAFSWMKTFEFRLKFHWRLFLRVQLTIIQHCFR